MTRRHWYVAITLTLGLVLLAAALSRIDRAALAETVLRLRGMAPLIVLASVAWQLLRATAWWCCFPAAARPSFVRVVRVRLSAEAFSFLTIWGTGEPLKVLMLDETSAAASTAAVVLERIAFMAVTAAIISASALATALVVDLGHGWTVTFLSFGIGTMTLIAVLTVAISRRGDHLSAVEPERAAALNTRQRVLRFVRQVERQLLHLARSDRRRLGYLVALESCCYVCMVLEVWLVLRAVGVSATFAAANGIETVTRVSSFLSAFIPANLGALEASNIAAAGALGAASAGAALAFVRRLRGLLWAAVGLALYPTRRGTSAPSDDDEETVAYIADDSAGGVSPFNRIVSLPIAERVMRAAAAADYRRLWVYAETNADRMRALAASLDRAPRVTVAANAENWRTLTASHGTRPVTLIGPATIASTALLRRARDVRADREIVDVPAGGSYPASGIFRASADELTDIERVRAFLEQQRTRAIETPAADEVTNGRAMLALRVDRQREIHAAEELLERVTYKATDPFLARFNRRLSIPVSRVLLRTPITANQISIALVGFGFYAAWLFSRGTYRSMLAGAVLSLVASIADGCDGEIARLKYQESSFGCWLETFGDYSYYVAIFFGMTIGAVRYTGWPFYYHIGMTALAAMLLTFALLIALRQQITAGRPERLQSATKAHFYASGSKWAGMAANLSFCATRSSMPYGILAFAIVGWLPAILVLAAIGANIFWISLALKYRAMVTDAVGSG